MSKKYYVLRDRKGQISNVKHAGDQLTECVLHMVLHIGALVLPVRMLLVVVVVFFRLDNLHKNCLLY